MVTATSVFCGGVLDLIGDAMIAVPFPMAPIFIGVVHAGVFSSTGGTLFVCLVSP